MITVVGGKSSKGSSALVRQLAQIAMGHRAQLTARVKQRYIERYDADSENVKFCHYGYYFEPSVVETVSETMLREQPKIAVLNERLAAELCKR